MKKGNGKVISCLIPHFPQRKILQFKEIIPLCLLNRISSNDFMLKVGLRQKAHL
jgi:hypothetical protein